MSLLLRNLFRPLLILLLVCSLTGCYAMKLAKGEKGIDVTTLQPGVTRAKAETILGHPVRSWASDGMRYAIYEYYAGTPPRPSDAMAIVFLDLLFLGMPEIAFGLGRNPLPNIYGVRDRIVLSYDNRDVTRGIFDEFDELPPDGQSGQRRWGSESTVSEK